jgi:hypothetical protein
MVSDDASLFIQLYLDEDVHKRVAAALCLRQAVSKMVLQVGGSISFAPEGDEAAHWQTYDTRHMLTEIDPKPD